LKLLIIFLHFAILFGLVTTTLARDDNFYVARDWMAEDGLPDNRVIGLAQTSDGYLWVTTQGALVRFDGVRFQRINIDRFPDYGPGTMRVFMLDRQGRIWLSKDSGYVFCIDGSRVRMLTPGQGLPTHDSQCSMVLDEKSNLWITYQSGKVFRCNQNGTLDNFTAANGLPDGDNICWLANGGDGNLWFAKGSHVGVFRSDKFDVLTNFPGAVRIATARSGGIWICDGQCVLRLGDGLQSSKLGEFFRDKPSRRQDLEPSTMFEDREGTVWVGTLSSGLFRCDSNAVTSVKVSNPAILSLTEDWEGNLWVGTRGGLSRLQRRTVSIIDTSVGFPFQSVQSVCQDATGALWLVGENGLLVRGKGTNWVIQSPAESSAQIHVNCVAAGLDSSVWIGGSGGYLYRWADGQFQNMGLNEALHRRSLRSLLTMSNGDLWIGTDEPDVLRRFHRGKLQLFVLPPGYRLIRAMAKDATGNFWAGAADGLLVHVAGDDLTVMDLATNLFSIRCLHAAANGDLWIGSAGHGVARLRNGNLTQFNTDQGLPNDYISQILTDDRGSVWFAGNQGIFQVREKDFDDLTEGLSARVWPVVYGRSENLPGLQANFDYYPDSCNSLDHRLFFSMLSGLAEINLDNVKFNYQPPKVFVERVVADNEVVNINQTFRLDASAKIFFPAELEDSRVQDEIRLPPGLQQVQFEFTALSFTVPENVRFRYRLEGLDTSWVDAGTRRVASYTHPPPGHYRFMVIACNNDGIWNKTGSTLSVTIEPYFWETLWFKSVVILVSFAALCGAVVLLLRHRHRLVVKKLENQRALDSERIRIARDLHDDLGVGLTEIGLLGDLAGANASVSEPSREKLQEITVRARSLATSLDEIVWAINPANDVSQSLTEYFFEYAQKLLNQAGISCRLKVVQPMIAVTLNAEIRHGLFYAFKEALNNVIRHSKATEVQVTVSVLNGDLSICVADNGRGLTPSDSGGSRDGLIGMRERLKNLGGRCEIEGNSESGTTVTFIIPIEPTKQL
jgi:signal transduction histidine kinase/ligand-binding sensor domain-containing protein